MARASSIPSIPSIPFPPVYTPAPAHTRARTRAHTHPIKYGRYGRYGTTNTGAGFGVPYLAGEVWKVWNMTAESAKLQVRAKFPRCIAVADEFRAAFGAGVRLVYASEGGQAVGTASPEPDRFITPDRMVLAPVVVEVAKPVWRRHG